MSFLWGSSGPSPTDVIIAMLDHQGKVIDGLVKEVTALSRIISKHFEKVDNVIYPVPKKMHERKVVDIDDSDIFHCELEKFFNGECVIEEEDDDDEDNVD